MMPDVKMDRTDIRQKSDSVTDNLITGLKVLMGELKWLVLKGLRAIEIRQLEKRLAKEYAAIGKQVHETIIPGEDGRTSTGSIPAADSAIHLSLKQIEFLQEEIDFLRDQCTRAREDDLKTRAKDLGLESGK
ncbi:hypothetical protein [Desulfobaculum sp.]|jgi:hypothetical protein